MTVDSPIDGLRSESDRLGLILAFVAVAKRNSYADAAIALGLTSSTVSRKISRLEALLGARLLNRTTRSVSLTEAGALYFHECQEILERLGEADKKIMSLNTVPRGILRISAPQAFGRLFLLAEIAQYMQKNPHVEIKVDLDDKYVDLVNGGYDLAIRIGVMSDSSLVARRLWNNDRILVASPSYVASHGPLEKPQELVNHNCLRFTRYAQGGQHWTFRRDVTETTVTVTGTFQSDDSEMIYNATLGGMGLGMVAEYLCQQAVREGRLIRMMPQWQILPQSAIFAVFPTTQHLPAKTRSFVDFLSSRLRASDWIERGRFSRAF